MANTMFGAMSGARPVNRAKLIHEYVEKSIPHIGRKPTYLSPYVLHLYQHYDCFIGEQEELLTIVADEVVYKLGPEAEMAETGTEDSSDPAVPEVLPVSSTPKIRKPTSPPPPPPRPEAGVTKSSPSFYFVLAREEKVIMTRRNSSLCNSMYISNIPLEYTQLD